MHFLFYDVLQLKLSKNIDVVFSVVISVEIAPSYSYVQNVGVFLDLPVLKLCYHTDHIFTSFLHVWTICVFLDCSFV